jgi:hypothetical protein
MRQQRTQQSPAAAPARAPAAHPTSGYVLLVDAQAKREFDTHESAVQAAQHLKARFPSLQIKVYDVEAKRAELIEMSHA